MKKLLFLAFAMSLSACGGDLKEMVNVRAPVATGDDSKVAIGPGVRVSAGTARAKGSAIGMQVDIGPSQNRLKSGNIGMQVGLSRSRTSQIR